jgi:predicted dehydrogenase
VSELEPVRLGIIGCGSVSQAYNELIRPLRLDGEVAVTMACDIDPDQRLLDGTTRLDRIHRLWPGTGFTRDPAELISSDDVDAVLVLTSTPSHFELAYAALEAGKHVLVEKPMATTLDEGRRLLELSRSAPGLLVCAPHIVLSPTYRALWRHVRDGDIGRVLLARARYGHGGHGLPPWFFQRGGGALFDFGESVFASVTTGFTMQKYRSPAIELYGSGGTLQMLGDDWAPAGYELWRNEVGAWQVFEDEDPRWYWMDGLPHMVRCIRDGTRPLNTPDHAYHALEIMLAAERSAADGRAHEIESDLPPLDLSSPDAEVVRYESHDRSVPRQ